MFLKKVFTKPFALKVMLSVLSLFILHDFLLSYVTWWSSFAFVWKHYIILSLSKVIHIYIESCSWSAKTANGVGFAVYWFGAITSSCCQANIQCKFNKERFSQGDGSYFPYILLNEIQTMFLQRAKRSARFLPADLCIDHAHYVKNHKSTVLRRNKSMAVEGGQVIIALQKRCNL